MARYSIRCGSSGADLAGNGNDTTSNEYSDNGYLNVPQAWTAPESFIIGDATTFIHYASPYNSGEVGLAPFVKNKVDSALEVKKQLPPSFTYKGPLGGAGPLGLFAPAVGSPKYNAYIEKVGAEAERKKQQNPVATEIAAVPTETSKWIGKVNESYNEFKTAVVEGYGEEKGHDLIDLIPGLSQLSKESSALPLFLVIGGGVLLIILLIK